MGITVGTSRFTDQDYADDAVLFADSPARWPEILTGFDEAAQTMGLHTSWTKTKLQNVGCGSAPPAAHIQGHISRSQNASYLGSDIDSSGRSTPEVIRRIGRQKVGHPDLLLGHSTNPYMCIISATN